jgi:hypothetical protein
MATDSNRNKVGRNQKIHRNSRALPRPKGLLQHSSYTPGSEGGPGLQMKAQTIGFLYFNLPHISHRPYTPPGPARPDFPGTCRGMPARPARREGPGGVPTVKSTKLGRWMMEHRFIARRRPTVASQSQDQETPNENVRYPHGLLYTMSVSRTDSNAYCPSARRIDCSQQNVIAS